jgi:hypothetical protein
VSKMYRVVFRNIPEELPSAEVYDYILSHAGVGEEVVHALRLRLVCHPHGGAVLVDYASRAAAEEALRHGLPMNGSTAVSARLLGAVHPARDSAAEAVGQSTLPVVGQKRRRNGGDDSVEAIDVTLPEQAACPKNAANRREMTSSPDEPQTMLLSVKHLDPATTDAEAFAAVAAAVRHHGGELHGLQRISSEEATLTVFGGDVLRASLFLDDYGQTKNRLSGTRKRVVVDLADPTFTPSALSEDGALLRRVCREFGTHAVVFCDDPRKQLDLAAFRRHFSRLEGDAVAGELAKVLAAISQGKAAVYRDDFGNVLMSMK